MTWKEIWKCMKNILLSNKLRKTNRENSNTCLRYADLQNENYVGLTSEHTICEKVYLVKVHLDRTKQSTAFDKLDALIRKASDYETAQKNIDDYNCFDVLRETDIFHNVLFCASCGNQMYFRRTKSMLPEQNYYMCKKCCSLHRIEAVVLEQIVLRQIHWVTELARKKIVGLEEVSANCENEQIFSDDSSATPKRIITIPKLTPEVLRAFIAKIYICEKEESGNDIDIVFTVGFREQNTVRTNAVVADMIRDLV